MTSRSARLESSPSLSLWLRLLKTHNLILARLRPAITAGGVTLPQFDVMAQLERSPAGMTFRDLSRKLLVSAGNLTGIVDRLEKDGLVRREVVAHDRRSFRVRLTPAGSKRIAALVRSHRRDVARTLACIPAPQQEALRDLLGAAARLLEADPRAGGSAGSASKPAVQKGLARDQRAS